MLIHSQWRRALLAAAVAAPASILFLSGNLASAQGTASKKGDASSAKDDPTAAGAAAQKSSVDWLIGKCVPNPDSPQFSDVKDAIAAFQAGDLAKAREKLTTAQKNNSKLPPVEDMIARLLAVSGQIGPARNELEQAVKAYPDDPEAYLLFSENALADRRFTDAESLLKQATPLIANYKSNLQRKLDFDIRLNAGLATVAEARGKWDTAADYIKEWLKLDEKNAAAHTHMGQAMFQKGDATAARDEFTQAQKLEPRSKSPYVALAQLYEQAGDHTKAARSIEIAVTTNPKDLNVQLAAAQWALATNQIADAIKYADAALQIDNQSMPAKIMRGTIARIKGDLIGAEKYLNEVVAIAPSNLDATNQLALALVDQDPTKVPDKVRRGLDYATTNAGMTTRGNQFNPEVLATYAWALYRNGDKQNAAKVLNQVISVGQISPDTAYYLATILDDAGKTAEAIKILDTAIASKVPFSKLDDCKKMLRDLNEKEAKEKGGDSKGSDSKGADSKGADSKSK